VPSTGNDAYSRRVPVWLCLRNDAVLYLCRCDTRLCAAGIPHRISAGTRGHDDRRPLLKWD
jgi:hypothetical protein